ncbi:maleylpyruvate isomerase family mycothiol-dependent enzyme [Rhodococcus sp. HNM0563]|uniref:maleylpyruvate isomerase family mycothiol-dependent enzyme n=1 Tax=Rhodococcus sp. HNM0563 TaxID=2716339 RepID=UPI00146E89F1|nr:maleylpyruvate isomerase family mycothiol-dependent enzyme [Rhodococcus sp. HNM0563]
MTDPDQLWSLVHAERTVLADDLADLDSAQWARRSLCGQWTVEQVVAHLTAVATVGPLRWIGSVVGARFDTDLHNARRLAEHLGTTPDDTLANFRRVLTSTTAPLGPTAAWLGEVVVHAQDIRRPLGISRTPAIAVTIEVARFYARKDFAVNSRTAAEGVRLTATDSDFTVGSGPEVGGPTLSLTMAMAGRTDYCDDLTGPGADILRARCP